jgi:hypothetical protein
MSGDKYAEVVWTTEDVLALRPDMTIEEAEEWLQTNEKHLRDRLIELGWDVMETLLAFDGK